MGNERDRRDASRLRAIVKRYVIERGDEETIDPYAVATAVLTKMTEHDFRLAAHLQLRQLARHLLRRDDLDKEDDGSTSASFSRDAWAYAREPEIPDLLQDRYPRIDHQGYIKRELMAEDDWRWNVDKLRREGDAKHAHATALEKWGRARGWGPATLSPKVDR